MPLSNTQARFGSVSKVFHWIVALGIFIAFPLGILATDAPYDTAEALAHKAQLFSFHKTLGVIVFFVALLRISWALSQPKPAPLHPERRLETFVAEVVHWALYGAMVLVPLSGWVHHAATVGFAPILWHFGQGLPFVPTSDLVAEAASAVHDTFKTVLLITVVLHVAGAIKHHVIDKDATLRRMLPGRTEAGQHTATSHALPALLAAAIWAVAGVGTLATQDHSAAANAPTLAAAPSDWTVQSGTLGISVQQFGKPVTGSFADWTAAIAFAPRDTPGKAGEVTVTVSIPSLTLGSVTSQALGADFLNAEANPTAIFTADIMATETGYQAPGTLTLRGVEVPATLPFDLTMDGDTATVSGQLILDRRAFNVGDSMTDEGQLGFAVPVTVDLTASKSQ
ncbi:cytochrome b/b6 domain-containing protein [Pseudoprimorskyibacter insulae]|uniref:Cytochrome b561 n=1 Tax=Pseudoprimorskyibacter insulae TaxID=1695997 RepID=A0A2R8AXS4_9RHOB|nr:cytochrome b/b6 domain-containing protein [Pseudoprimorskyibacter insulae]SPF80845.1 Cytochrome b561 [Pseudoprimorskyibacter insulae]